MAHCLVIGKTTEDTTQIPYQHVKAGIGVGPCGLWSEYKWQNEILFMWSSVSLNQKQTNKRAGKPRRQQEKYWFLGSVS